MNPSEPAGTGNCSCGWREIGIDTGMWVTGLDGSWVMPLDGKKEGKKKRPVGENCPGWFLRRFLSFWKSR